MLSSSYRIKVLVYPLRSRLSSNAARTPSQQMYPWANAYPTKSGTCNRHLSSLPQLQPLPEEFKQEQILEQGLQQPYHQYRYPSKPRQSSNHAIVIKQGRRTATVSTTVSTQKIDIIYKRLGLSHQWSSSQHQQAAISTKSLLGRVREPTQSLIEAFLPADYKTSVTPEYMSYMKWQFVHNTLGAASGVLATQAMLYAMGLGAGALPLSAAINWVIKDGFGQLGGVAYATMVGQKFDSDPKHLRFWSAVWLQCATWLEMLTPLVPHLFLFIGSIANIGKNISWLAMSATKASINKSFCLKQNLGDLTAKHGSQATAAGLLGTAMGILVGATVDISFYTLIIGFVPLSLVSLWGNYKSILCTVTPTLNLERARHMLGDTVALDTSGQLVFNPYLLKSPRQVSSVERFMRETKFIEPEHMLPGIIVSANIDRVYRDIGGQGVKSGVARMEAAQMVKDAFSPSVAVVCDNEIEWPEKYYIGYLARSCAKNTCNGNVYLWFDARAAGKDMLLGLYHSFALRLLLSKAGKDDTALDTASIINNAYQFALHTFGDFGKAVTMSGWDLTSVYFGKKSKLIQVVQTKAMQVKQQ